MISIVVSPLPSMLNIRSSHGWRWALLTRLKNITLVLYQRVLNMVLWWQLCFLWIHWPLLHTRVETCLLMLPVPCQAESISWPMRLVTTMVCQLSIQVSSSTHSWCVTMAYLATVDSMWMVPSMQISSLSRILWLLLASVTVCRVPAVLPLHFLSMEIKRKAVIM